MILAQVTEFNITYSDFVTTTVSLDSDSGVLKVTESCGAQTHTLLSVEVDTDEGQEALRGIAYWDGEILSALKSQIRLTKDEQIREELTKKYGF